MNYRRLMRNISAGCAILALAASFSGPSAAQSGEPFFAGKTIELLVPLRAGGGTDRTARFLAEYLTKFIDGDPSVQVRVKRQVPARPHSVWQTKIRDKLTEGRVSVGPELVWRQRLPKVDLVQEWRKRISC